MAEPFTHAVRVRYGECDPQGVVFNSHYLAYLDVGLTELWRVAVPGGYQGMVRRGIDMVVAEARLRFHSPARFDDELAISIAVEHLGTTSMQTSHHVRRGSELLVHGQLRHVFVALQTLTKTPIPERVRDGLARFADGA